MVDFVLWKPWLVEGTLVLLELTVVSGTLGSIRSLEFRSISPSIKGSREALGWSRKRGLVMLDKMSVPVSTPSRTW